MSEIQSVLLYVVGAAVLIMATMLFQVDPDSELAANFAITSTPTPTIIPSTTPVPPTLPRIEAGPEGCVTTPWGGKEGYRPDAPLTSNLIPEGIAGKRLVISGIVRAADCHTPIAGVLVEVWHANEEGRFGDSALRGRLITDETGRYEFITLKPSRFVANNLYVPAKVHFRVSFPEAPTLWTELFLEGDPFLSSAPSAQVRLTRPVIEEEGSNGPILRVTFDISLEVEPPQG